MESMLRAIMGPLPRATSMAYCSRGRVCTLWVRCARCAVRSRRPRLGCKRRTHCTRLLTRCHPARSIVVRVPDHRGAPWAPGRTRRAPPRRARPLHARRRGCRPPGVWPRSLPRVRGVSGRSSVSPPSPGSPSAARVSSRSTCVFPGLTRGVESSARFHLPALAPVRSRVLNTSHA